MSRGLWIHVLIGLEEAFWQPDLSWWANFEKVTLRWHGSWCYYRSWQKLWKSWNPLRSLHKHRAKEMLPFQAGKLPPLWYVKMGLWPQEETSLLATGAPEVIRLDLQAQNYYPISSMSELPKLSTDFSACRLGSSSWQAKYSSSCCLSFIGINANYSLCHWSEVTSCHAQHGHPGLLYSSLIADPLCCP